MPPGRRLFPQLARLDAITTGTSDASADAADKPQDQDPIPADRADAPSSAWFLGLDIGTSGLSAVLVNQTTKQLIPVFWQQSESSQRWFRWPLNYVAELAQDISDSSETATTAEAAVLCQLKSALALPLRREGIAVAESPAGLEPAYRPLVHRLTSLNPNQSTAKAARTWTCGGVGLGETAFTAAMEQLCGIGISYPVGWPARYRVNIQNAILEAGLIAQPDAIYAVEEAIAATTACLRAPNQKRDRDGDKDDRATTPPPAQGIPLPYPIDFEGVAFVLNAGASTTELALVNLVALGQGEPSVLASRTLAYAGYALDQDILIHHLYPQLQASSLADVAQLLSQLQLNRIDHPQLGQPDVIKRLRLHLRLCSSGPGQQLLAIAQQIKYDLQHLPQSTYTVAQHQGHVMQDEFGHHVLLPYIRSLTQQVQSLVEQATLLSQSVRYIICSGGTAEMRVIHLWAQQCFPDASLLFAPSVARVDATELEATSSSAWLGSQVAYGLARLPLFARADAETAGDTAQ